MLKGKHLESRKEEYEMAQSIDRNVIDKNIETSPNEKGTIRKNKERQTKATGIIGATNQNM